MLDDKDGLILETVKRAHRIKSSTLYDEELKMYIQTVFDDIDRLGISIKPDDARLVNLCVLKSKGYFGNSSPDVKQLWLTMYNEQLKLVYMDGRRCSDAV
ncbi:phage head-tail connector protein [Faecalibaculum rodentium]|uniref:phage head-tail connector protein n=1 Tax=Faecalibaculum rodentium TaxID=1702221 RepID=UPI0023F3DB1B|nr:hypothetical protein [Faecalibaculum rodentium]